MLMFKFSSVLIIFSFTLTFINSLYKLGSCPKLSKNFTDFDLKAFMGPWYEIARTRGLSYELGVCVKLNMTMNFDQSVNITSNRFLGGVNVKTDLVAVPTDFSLLKYKLANVNDFCTGNFFNNDFKILLTNYHNYAVLYSCKNVGFGRNEYIWIFLRKPEDYLGILNQILDLLALNMDVSKYDLALTGENC